MKRTIIVSILALLLAASTAHARDRVFGGGGDTSDMDMAYESGASLQTVQDWADSTQSSGRISGGAFSDAGGGGLDVAAGVGFIRSESNADGEVSFVSWSATSLTSLTDEASNYIYYDYTSGVSSTTTKADVDDYTAFMLGRVYREGTRLHILDAGVQIHDIPKRVQHRLGSVDGKVVRASGLALAETGTLHFSITAGKVFAGLTEKTLSSIDTSGGTPYELYYRDGAGGWNETSLYKIDADSYDDNSGTTTSLNSNKYGVHWMYMDFDGTPLVVMGQDEYSEDDAEAAQIPSSLPDHVSDFATIVGKITAQEGETSFEETESAFVQTFQSAEGTDHNALAGLQGGTAGEYYHLDSTEFGYLDGQDQSVLTGATPTYGDVEYDRQTLTGDSTLTDSGVYVCNMATGVIKAPEPGSSMNGRTVRLVFTQIGSGGVSVFVNSGSLEEYGNSGATAYNRTNTAAELELFYSGNSVFWTAQSSGTWTVTY